MWASEKQEETENVRDRFRAEKRGRLPRPLFPVFQPSDRRLRRNSEDALQPNHGPKFTDPSRRPNGRHFQGMGQSFRLAGSGPGGDTRALLSVEEVFDSDEEVWGHVERREVTCAREGKCKISMPMRPSEGLIRHLLGQTK